MTRFWPLLAVLLLSAGALRAPAAPYSHATPVEDVSQQWAGYWNAKNLDGLMGLYAMDPAFAPASGGRWQGKGEIRFHLMGGLGAYDPHLVLRSTRSEVSGNLAFDSGTYTESLAPTKGGAEIRSKGRYLFVFRRASRRAPWRIVEQGWTELGFSKF